jgi:hypothetical protein
VSAPTRRVAAATAVAVALASALAAPARAEWLSRTVDGIMGTRIVVELWDRRSCRKGEAAIDAVMDEMRHIDSP